jgi:hypothetical protein
VELVLRRAEHSLPPSPGRFCLQKPQIAVRQFFRQKTKQAAIVD